MHRDSIYPPLAHERNFPRFRDDVGTLQPPPLVPLNNILYGYLTTVKNESSVNYEKQCNRSIRLEDWFLYINTSWTMAVATFVVLPR